MTATDQIRADASQASSQVEARPRVVGAFMGGAALITFCAVAATAALTDVSYGPVLATALTAGAGFIAACTALRRHHPHRRLGAANAVTSIRWGIVSILVGLLIAGAPSATPIIGLAIVALSLDGLDGRLARQQRLESRFGASFDMEVDSVFALVLAALAALGPAGPVALVLGTPRYLFGAAAIAAPWLTGSLPERYSRKVICVIQLIALIVLHLPWLPTGVAVSVVLLTAAALAWSFTVDIIALRRARTA